MTSFSAGIGVVCKFCNDRRLAISMHKFATCVNF